MAIILISRIIDFVYGLETKNIDGFCGYMSDVGDTADMAKNALSILQDEATYQKFKANALLQARKFDIGNIVPKYEELYRKIIG